MYLDKSNNPSGAMTDSTARKEMIQSVAIGCGFRIIKSDTGVKLYVLRENANYSSSVATLTKAGLVLADPKDDLLIPMIIKNDEAMKGELKGHDFYVAGKGIEWYCGITAISKEGRFIVPPDDASLETTFRVSSGKKMLSLQVYEDRFADICGCRFALDANSEPYGTRPLEIATMVVGAEPGAAPLARAAELRR
jgi:hypothetical protein